MRRIPTLLATGFVAAMPALLAACGDPPPTPPATGLDAAMAKQLLERLDRVAAALEAISRNPATATAPAPVVAERTSVAAGPDELLARIQDLEQQLAQLRARNGGGAWPAGRPLVAPPMARPAVEQIVEQLRSADQNVQQTARRSMFLMTQPQALERFGMPSDVGIADASVTWYYEVGESSFSLEFVNGLATAVRN